MSSISRTCFVGFSVFALNMMASHGGALADDTKIEAKKKKSIKT
jgi:hypothetical protein